jgi:hypothetical protein
MNFQTTIRDTNFRVISTTILDSDTPPQPYPDAASLPAGMSVSFKSSDESIISLVPRPDGLSVEAHTGKAGTAVVDIVPVGMPPAFTPDSIAITVEFSDPNSLNTVIGDEQPEVLPPSPQLASIRTASKSARTVKSDKSHR